MIKTERITCDTCRVARDKDSWYCDIEKGVAMCPMCSAPNDLTRVLGQTKKTKDEAECQNCGRQFLLEQLLSIRDFHQRVEPGEICPAGDCPKCGALCHLKKQPALTIVLRDPDGNIHGIAQVEGLTKAGAQVLNRDATLYFNQHVVAFSAEQVTQLKGQAAAEAWLKKKNGA